MADAEGTIEEIRANLLQVAKEHSEDAKGSGPTAQLAIAAADAAMNAYWKTFPEEQRKAGAKSGKAPSIA